MMKAFSFLTILESLSKKLSILRTKMHSDDLRVDYESITSQLRVSRPFSLTSLTASRRTSFALSRRASHFAAILTILFTVGVGSVWGASPYNLDITSYAWGGTGNKSANDGTVTISGYIQSKTYNNTGSTIVAYLDGSNYLTVSATSACITSITVTANTDNNSNEHEIAYQTSTDGSSWSASTNIGKCANRKSAPTSQTANFSPAVQYVRFTKGGSNSISVGAISITYTDGGGETPNPDPDQPGTGGDGDSDGCTKIFWFANPDDATKAGVENNTTTFSGATTGSNPVSGSITIDGKSYSVTGRGGTNNTSITFSVPANKVGTLYGLATTSSNSGTARTLTLTNTASYSKTQSTSTSQSVAGEFTFTDMPAGSYTLAWGGNGAECMLCLKLCDAATPSCTTPTTAFANGSYTVGGSALDLSTLFESNSNGAVTYTVTNANGTGATIDGTSFTASAAGTATVKATQAANGDYCSGEATATITVNAAPVTPEPEAVPQVGTFTGMGMSGSVNLYWTMPTKPVTTRVDIASATLSAAVGQSDGATSTNTKENTNEIKVEYSTDGGWKATGVQIPLATPQKNVESITFEYKSASNQSVDLIPFLYDGTTRWVESGFAKLTPTEWTSHTSVITKQAWVENLYSTDKTIESVNFYANPATATSGTFYIRNVVLNQGTQVAASGLIIVRKVGSNPTSPTDGTQVYDGNGIAATCTDNGLTNGTTYHYAAYAHDGQGNYSEPLYWQYTYIEGLNTYAPDDTDFPNPERGFYEQVQWNANKGYDAVIGDSYFDDARAASRSLILRIYYMDSNELRQNDQLPAAFITMFNEDMEKFRTNGMKCILRFAYDENSGDGYQDASPETWATHLAQLKTHLEANADVIYVVQAGFLGVWGEWYYSSEGTGNDEIELSIKNNLIDQLLAAVPANRCVQLRTPKFKRDYLTSKSIPTDALTLETAYQNTPKARLGHHNDAFLNGEENQGTYEYGKRTTDMAYIAQECMYVPIGGETNLEESQVDDLYDKYCKDTVAEAEMAQLHYSYLNYSYSTVVTNKWRDEGSYARMSKQLGYRFELESATLPNKATAGTQMKVQLNIKNVGYAPLYNERHAYIVFRYNTNTYSIRLKSDPRTWAPNKVTTTIDENIELPDNMVAGTYDMYLHLPDASDNIANDPKYAVRFANQGIWESETGYNKLNKQVVVTATEPATYTITFKNGETVLQTSTIEYGATPEYTDETPTKAEDAQYTYTFSGWNPAITAVTGDATYTATFTQTAKNYTLTWDVNGGNALTGDYTKGTIAYGTTITKPADPTREGYTFAGWSPAVAATMPAANTTYTAQWEEIKVASITVNPTTLDLKKGESATLTATVSPNNALNKTVTWTNPSITTLSSETGNSITVTGKSNGNEKDLKASAGGKQATVKVYVYYEVQYNSNGGSACTAGKYYEGNGVTLPTPTRDGYTFAGWYKNEDLTQSAGDAGATYKPSDNITLYAKWTVAKTNPTTTWTVAETAYAGQLVTVSVTTNSDATLTTGSLTTNKGTLANATVNGKTITATLQVPGNASDDITLTLRTDATDNYNASTSTKTITLSECPTNGGGGEEVIYSMYLTGQTACSVTGGTASLSKVSSTTLTVNKKSYYKFDSSTKITISPTNGIKSGDKLIVDIASTDANAVGFYLKNSDNTLATCTTTIAKESATTITYTFTKDVPIVDITRTDSNLRFYGASITRASGSGSGESTLPTNLAWSTDLSAEVSKQAGTTFTYTASSNNSAGAITYSSSNTSVATVNQTTGEVTTKAAGTAIITATIAEIGCYPTKSITYTLTVTSTGTPEPTTYTVTYNLGGGTGTLPTQEATTAGGTFTLASSNNITKSGYTFAGWNDGTTTYAAGATYTMPASNVTLTAQWTPEKYDINYYEAVGEVNDINELKEIEIAGAPTSYTILDEVTLPALPAKDGYTATGWYSQYCVFEDGGNGKGWNGCKTTTGHLAGYYGHANYIVKYTAEPGTLYTVTVNSATNGTVTADKTTNVAQGETVMLTVTPASGYELETLTVKDASDNNVSVTNNTFTMPASNVTVSATFTAIETPEQGECEILVNAEITAKNAADKTGMWASDATVTASVQDKGNGTTGWKLGTDGNYFRISLTENTFKAGDIVTINIGTGGVSEQLVLYSDNGETEIGSKTEKIVQGANEITLTADSKVINLYRLNKSMNPWVISMSVKRCSIPATPEPGSYILTYDENKPSVWNDDFAVKNIPEEQTLTDGTGNVPTDTPNPPVITEDADSDYPIYTFTGWNTAANGSGTSYAAGAAITITENTTLYAQWTPCTFDVKYFDKDKKTPLEGMVNTTYTFGVGIPTLPTPTKPGQTFAGWIAFWDGGQSEGTVTEIEPTTWGDAQLAALWQVNCTMPTTTFANTKYTIGSGVLNLSTLIADNTSGGEITYAVTGGVAATINGSSFTCDRIGAVTVTATQAANGGYCEKIMTATINVAMPVTDGCAQMFTFKANDAINNPDGQKGKKYLDLSSYATINGLSTTGKVGIKDMTTSDDESTTLILDNEIYFPNTNTYLKVENLSTPLAAGDEISIGTKQSATEYIITISGTQCKSNCITTTDQQYTILTGSSLIGVTTFYIWSANAERYLKTIDICRPAYEITYKANNGTAAADVVLNDAVLVAGCPNTFTEPAGKQFAGWNTAANGSGTSYSVGTIIPEDNLILYAQWECIEPVFTVSCDKTAYAKGEDDAKPITVTVTAGNSGGVTYQWYASDKNDRTTGTKITGAIAASYTPSTATAGTTYYWCEISNSCTAVKTPTIAITVTVTKNNPVVTWSDPSDVNYGGGGYSISATVNDGWNGTLLPSMLTAPTGVIIKGVTITGKTIEATFDVTTTFDRTIENHKSSIPFVLTLPETTTYNPLVSENEVDYNACATSVGSGEIILEAAQTNGETSYYFAAAGTVITSIESAGAKKVSIDKNNKVKITVDATHKEATITFTIGTGIIVTGFKVEGSNNDNTKYYLDGSEITIGNDVSGLNKTSSLVFKLQCTDQSGSSNRNTEISSFVLTCTSSDNGEDVSLEWDTTDDLTKQVEKKQSDPNFTYKATPSNNTLGTITYSSSNANVATVNSTTGEVSIIAAGTTTITATLAPSGCYQGATATYELDVTEEICAIAAGTLSASKTDKYDCEAVTLTLSNYEQDATIEWWHNGEAITSKPAGITINGNTLTTTVEGTYSALVTKGCSIRSNSVTITNIASASAAPLVNEWYIKSGRLTPPIALWKLEGGARIAGVGWMRGEEASTAPYDNSATAIYEENGIVYLTGTPPQANETGEDIRYTIQLTIKNSCDDSPMVVPSTITIVHQKNTDKHVLAFVVTGKEKGGFTEEITTAQTTNVALYNEISQVFDVLATNIYATDNEQLLKEYYSRFDIICITDYPDSKKTGVNGKSYTNAMGALIDIRPILSMEAWVSKYSNWNDKGITGDPKSPTTRQYSMLLQCKDHEIFTGTNLIQVGSGDELMYRVTMVDKNQEQYKTLDDTYGATTPHAEKATTKIDDVETITGYGYGSNPALQGFTYTSSMSSMLPIGIIDDGAGTGNNLQVGLERQHEIEARMIVLGVNSYAMERLTDDGERVIINTLKYLMKKQSSEIADCSIYFDNNNGKGDNQWNNPANWAPSRNSLPHASQEARILAPCIVSDVVAKVASIKIVPDGKYAPAYNGGIDAKGSLTIAPDGALVVGGHIQAATAPNYYEARPTTPENLIVQAEVESDSQHRLGALIHDNKNGETSATIQMWNPSYWEIDQETGNKKKYWSYVAVPIQEAPIPEFFYHGFTYLYDETQGWIKKGDGTVLYPFQGIGASLQTGNKETFYGKLATTDDQDIILTKTTGVGEGQNLIGNSWTAPIQIANFEEADFNDATATVYVYNTGRDDKYKDPTYVVGSVENDGAATAGQWIGVPIGVAGLAEYTGLKVIPAMNAFQVNTAQETELHLNYNRLVRGEGKGGVNSESNLNQPMRAPHKPIEALMRIRVAGEKTHTDMWLLQDERFDYGFDNGWEAEFVEGDDRSAQLYAVSEIGKMAFLAQPELDGTLLGFAPSRDGAEYTFSFYYTGSQKLYLNDLKLQTSTLVSDNDTYLFTYEKGDEQRFIISTAPFNIPDISTGVGNTTNGENAKAVKFIKDDKIFIFVNGTLYDATGKMVIR